MKHFIGALAAFQIAFFPLAGAVGAPACSPKASGVGGVIADQKDVIAAVNCLGQQLADVRASTFAVDQAQAARIEELARQIGELQNVVAALSQRISDVEARVLDIQRPLAMPPTQLYSR